MVNYDSTFFNVLMFNLKRYTKYYWKYLEVYEAKVQKCTQ